MSRKFFPTVVCSFLLLSSAPAFAVTGASQANTPVTQAYQMRRMQSASVAQYNAIAANVTREQAQLAQLRKAVTVMNTKEIAQLTASVQSQTNQMNQLRTEISRENGWMRYYMSQSKDPAVQTALYNAHQDRIAAYTARKQQAAVNQENADEVSTEQGHDDWVAKNTPPAPPAGSAGAGGGPIYYDPWYTVVFPDLN